MTPDDADAPLSGLRILVVEDLYLIASEIEAELRKLGATVVGPARSLSAVHGILASHEIDLAVLDVNLAGDMVFPLAQDFARTGKPFLFLTGYGDWAMPAEWRRWPRLCKPVDGRDLRDGLVRLWGAGGRTAGG